MSIPAVTPSATSFISVRSAGILLHITSLPSPFGIGDLGPTARQFVDLLALAHQTWWQVLPLNPPAAGDSPYQCFSAFAGNPAMISPEELVTVGLLDASELPPPLPQGRINFPAASAAKGPLLDLAHRRFLEGRGGPQLRDLFTLFCQTHRHWLEDYALFMALREQHPGLAWSDWPAPLATRDPAALEEARKTFAQQLDALSFQQFLFATQLASLRNYARTKGVRLIGDMPIFVSMESADAWAHRQLFTLDPAGKPITVAGVPPDMFSETGQFWGNPLYDWHAMAAEGFKWWVRRLQAALEQADLVRIDHFRGFAACWTIPAAAKTAQAGHWEPTPGAALLATLQHHFAPDPAQVLPVIAEDLGVITPDVDELRTRFRLPGMKILQFGFDRRPSNQYLPHNFSPDTVVYTGTHDNDTTRGWYDQLPSDLQKEIQTYLPAAARDPATALLESAWASTARLAIAPLQDLLSLPNDARMNLPGTPTGNWSWRSPPLEPLRPHFERLGELTERYNRLLSPPK